MVPKRIPEPRGLSRRKVDLRRADCYVPCSKREPVAAGASVTSVRRDDYAFDQGLSALILRPFHMRLAALCLVAAAFWVSPSAHAQSLPASLIQSLQLSAEDAAQVAAYVEQNSAKLGSKDPEAIRKDRAALLAPLSDPGISTSFRQQYSRVVLPKLEPLAADQDELTVINALVIAGDLGTDGAADLVMAKLGASNASIRYQSSYAFQRLFGTMSGSGATLKSSKAQAIVAAIEPALARESDPLVVDGLIRAGLAAAQIDSIRSEAVAAVAGGTSKLLQSKRAVAESDQLVAAALRAGSGITEVLANPAATVRTDSVKAAAGLGGDMMAYVSRAITAKGVPLTNADAKPRPGEVTARELHAQVALSGETLVLLCGKTLNATFDAPNRKSGEKLRVGTVKGDAEFLVEIGTVVGNDGILAGEPFKFPPNRFPGK